MDIIQGQVDDTTGELSELQVLLNGTLPDTDSAELVDLLHANKDLSENLKKLNEKMHHVELPGEINEDLDRMIELIQNLSAVSCQLICHERTIIFGLIFESGVISQVFLFIASDSRWIATN